MQASLRRALVLATVTAVGGCCDDSSPAKADDCFHYCQQRFAAGCMATASVGECVDVACAVEGSNLRPACKELWTAHYTCTLRQSDICNATACPDPTFDPACAS
jgi:hypothetical protein